MMRVQHVLLAGIVLGAMWSCASDPARQEEPIAHDAHALRTRLIEGQWRLFSWVYPVIPTEGYPIEFEADGNVKTKNLALTETWWLTDDLTLHLASSAKVPRMELSYDVQAGVFVHQPEAGPSFVIGPRSFGFDEYLNELAAHGNRAR